MQRPRYTHTAKQVFPYSQESTTGSLPYLSLVYNTPYSSLMIKPVLIKCFHFLCEIWDIFAEKQRGQVSIQLFSQNLALLWMSNVFIRATCKTNKLHLLNSTWKMVKVDHWSSLCWSLIPPIPLPQINSSGSFVTLHVHFVQNNVISVPPPPPHSVQRTGWSLMVFKIYEMCPVSWSYVLM